MLTRNGQIAAGCVNIFFDRKQQNLSNFAFLGESSIGDTREEEKEGRKEGTDELQQG